MKYTVEFTQQELAVIYQGLGELPLKLSLNLFAKLQQEQKRQDQEQAVPLSSLGLTQVSDGAAAPAGDMQAAIVSG